MNNISMVQWAEPATKDGFTPVVHLCTCMYLHVFIYMHVRRHMPFCYIYMQAQYCRKKIQINSILQGDKLRQRAPPLIQHLLFTSCLLLTKHGIHYSHRAGQQRRDQWRKRGGTEKAMAAEARWGKNKSVADLSGA